jgi:hypothetical protein
MLRKGPFLMIRLTIRGIVFAAYVAYSPIVAYNAQSVHSTLVLAGAALKASGYVLVTVQRCIAYLRVLLRLL